MRRKEGGRRIVLLIFVLYLLVGEGLWVGAESLILGQLKSHLFPAGIYADAISMIHSGYFYILFLWAIVVSDFPPLEIHKYLDLPCLVSLLQRTAKQITISINIIICFCCFKYYTVMVYKKNWKWSVWYISNGLQKKLFVEKKRFFSVDYVKINEINVVKTWRHIQSE